MVAGEHGCGGRGNMGVVVGRTWVWWLGNMGLIVGGSFYIDSTHMFHFWKHFCG